MFSDLGGVGDLHSLAIGKHICTNPKGAKPLTSITLASNDYVEDVVAELLKNAEAGSQFGMRRQLEKLELIDNASRRYKLEGFLGGGTYGKVWKFKRVSGPPGGNVAVKLLLGSPENAKHWSNELRAHLQARKMLCPVVQAITVADGTLQVMELGPKKARFDRYPTDAELTEFITFANEAALCLMNEKLACTDWKLDNLTYFDGSTWGCSGFRIIDLDGIEPYGSQYAHGVATFSCGYIPSPTGPDDWYAMAMQMVTTAYCIELSKLDFAGELSDELIGALASVGARKREWMRKPQQWVEMADRTATTRSTYKQLTRPGMLPLCQTDGTYRTESTDERTERLAVMQRPLQLLFQVDTLMETIEFDSDNAQKAYGMLGEFLKEWFSTPPERHNEYMVNPKFRGQRDYFFTPKTSPPRPKFNFLWR